MSQHSQTDDILSWGVDECNAQFSQTYPVILKKFQNANGLKELTETLKILCSEQVIQCMKPEELHVQLFSKISSKVYQHVYRILNDMSSSVAKGESQSQIAEQILFSKECLHCMEVCMVSVGKIDTVYSKYIDPIYETILKLLKVTYIHCKDSSVIYGDMISSLTESLTSLFKKSHSLQTAFSNILERIHISTEATKDEIHFLSTCCHELYEVTTIVNSLDARLVVATLKTISRIVTQYAKHIKCSLNVDRIVSGLCTRIDSSYGELYHRKEPNLKLTVIEDEKTYVKSVKLISFQMKFLVMFVKEFTIDSSSDTVYKLLISLYRLYPPALTAPELSTEYKDTIDRHILVATDPMLSYLLNNTSFSKTVLSIKESNPDNLFPRCFLLTSIVSLLAKSSDDVTKLWMNKERNVVNQLFTSVKLCHKELCLPLMLPGVMCNGESSSLVPLYQYILVRLSSFVVSLPSILFPLLEKTLLEWVVTVGNVIANLMAIDLWCIISRYGSAELCLQQCLQIAVLINYLPRCGHISYLFLILLLRRLFKFLSSEHQVVFCDKFTIQDHLDLWAELPQSSLCPAATEKQIDALFSVCKNCDLNRHKQLQCLKGLLSLGQNPAVISSTVMKLWSDNASMSISDFIDLVKLSSELIVNFKDADLLLILDSVWNGLKMRDEGALYLVVADFVATLRKCQFKQQTEQSVKILSLIPEIFVVLLKSKTPLIQTRALEAFTLFAEETCHGNIVPDCVRQCDQLQSRVVQFLQKVPHNPNESFELMKYLTEQESQLNKLSLESSSLKRRRSFSPQHDGDGQAKTFISQIEQAVAGLESIRQGQLPDDLLNQLSIILNRLNQLRNNSR